MKIRQFGKLPRFFPQQLGTAGQAKGHLTESWFDFTPAILMILRMEFEFDPAPQEKNDPVLQISPGFAGLAAAGLLIAGIALGCFYPRRPAHIQSSSAPLAEGSGVWSEAYAQLAWDITARHGWHDAHILLQDVLPEMVRHAGARVEIREIAIAALSRKASATIPAPSNIAIIISPDERWLILNGLRSLLFFDIEHPDGFFYRVPAEARRLYASGQDLIYEERGQWKKRSFKAGDSPHYQLGSAQEISKPPASQPTNLPPNPLQVRIDQKGMVRLYDSISTPVRILGEVQVNGHPFATGAVAGHPGNHWRDPVVGSGQTAA